MRKYVMLLIVMVIFLILNNNNCYAKVPSNNEVITTILNYYNYNYQHYVSYYPLSNEYYNNLEEVFNSFDSATYYFIKRHVQNNQDYIEVDFVNNTNGYFTNNKNRITFVNGYYQILFIKSRNTNEAETFIAKKSKASTRTSQFDANYTYNQYTLSKGQKLNGSTLIQYYQNGYGDDEIFTITTNEDTSDNIDLQNTYFEPYNNPYLGTTYINISGGEVLAYKVQAPNYSNVSYRLGDFYNGNPTDNDITLRKVNTDLTTTLAYDYKNIIGWSDEHEVVTINNQYITYNNPYMLQWTTDGYIYEHCYFIFINTASDNGGFWYELNNSGDYELFYGRLSGDRLKEQQEQENNENLNKIDEHFNEILNHYMSGDLFDYYSEGLGQIENPYENFYLNFYNHLYDAFTYSGDASISFTIKNEDNTDRVITINSNDFNWNIPVLNDLLYIIYWLGFGFSYIRMLYYLYEHLSTFNIKEVTNKFSNDKDIL